jgi:hypothetical protein
MPLKHTSQNVTPIMPIYPLNQSSSGAGCIVHIEQLSGGFIVFLSIHNWQLTTLLLRHGFS